jgi:hypothetical protein
VIDRRNEQEGWTGPRTKEFLDAAATLGAGAAVFSEGLRYVDDVEFWHWFTTEVVKAPRVGGESVTLTDSEAIRAWVEGRVASGRGGGLETLLRGRNFEYEFVRSHQHDPLELLRGNIWRRGTAAEDSAGIDAVRRNLFTGDVETHQLKHALSDSGTRVNLSKYGPDGSKPVDVIDVNERIGAWRSSPGGRDTIAARGDAHPDVRVAVSDRDVSAGGDRRLAQAQAGDAAPAITVDGALTQAGRGALIGAVVGVGLSAATNYVRYRRGDISGAEFGDYLVTDSARGALMGGAIAVVNLPVQVAGYALGVGSPVTIPVMLVLGAGIRQIVEPMFGRGEYARQLADLEVTTDLAAGVARFASTCEAQRPFLEGLAVLGRRARRLNAISVETDELLDRAIDEI